MGVVYEARDPTLDRAVAIKVIPVDENGVEQTLGEARMLARLTHPNVVAVYEAGLVDDAVYIAMELVAGPTLRQWAADQRTPDEILRVLIEAAQGLSAAHEQGITHRDFKPDNVILSEDDAVVVADFGLARLASSTASTGALGADATMGVSAVAGTPAYMAPEQRRSGVFGPASDQYAFCITLCELMTGSCPTSDEVATTDGRGKPLESQRVVQSLPSWLRPIVSRGLHPDPDARWPSMSALLRQLRNDPRARRRRRLAFAGWGAAAVAGGFAVLAAIESPTAAPCENGDDEIEATWNTETAETIGQRFESVGGPAARGTWSAVEPALDRYAEQWAAMHDENCAATRLRGEQSDRRFDMRLTCLDQRRQELAAIVEGFAAADETTTRRALDAIAAMPPVAVCAETETLETTVAMPASPEARRKLADVTAKTARANALRSMGRLAESESIAAEAAAEARALGHDPTLAEALGAHAKALVQRQAPEAEATLREALDAASRGRHDRAAVAMWQDLLNVVGIQDTRFDEAAGLVTSARAAALRMGQPPDVWGTYLANAATFELGRGRLDEATRLAREAAALAEEHLDESDVSAISRLNLLAGVLRRSGKLEDARDLLAKALGLAEAHLPAPHALRLTLQINIAAIELDLGEPERAVEYAGAAVDVATGTEWVAPALSVQALAVLGMAEARVGHHDAAVEAGRQMLERLDGEQSGLRVMALQTIGLAHYAAGRATDAVESLTATLELAEKVFGADHPQIAIHTFNLALAQRDAGLTEAAIASYERARALQEKASGPHETTVISSLVGQGELELELHRVEEAVAHLERAVELAASPESQGADTLLRNARAALARAEAADAETGALP